MILGINASRARSGGAKAHLIGILTEGGGPAHGFAEVHVWSYREMLDALPVRPWLFKHCSFGTPQPIWQQLLWERVVLPKELRAKRCDILFNVDAGTVCRFHPNVTLSQDMLSYEPGEIERYGWGKARLRLILLRYFQNQSLRRSDGAIFLTRHAANVIQKTCGTLQHIAFVPHGIGQNFQKLTHRLPWPVNGDRPIRLLYISNAEFYKHQWMVIRAVEKLRGEGVNVILTLVGGGSGVAQVRLRRQMIASDPRGEFVIQKEFVPQTDLPGYLADSDIFIFASSCENMPITLLEAMAAGLPIVCSRRGPMPEVLEDAGEYFDPEVPESIANALRKLIADADLRQRLAVRAKTLAACYSWERCAKETWSFIADTINRLKRRRTNHLT